MTLKRKFIFLIFLVLAAISFSAYILNLEYLRFRNNMRVESLLLKAAKSLEQTSSILNEYMIRGNSREYRQLKIRIEDFRYETAFRELGKYTEYFSFIAPVVSKKEDLLFYLDNIINLVENSREEEIIFQETLSQLFLLNHEMKMYVIDLYNQVGDITEKETKMFIFSVYGSFLFVTFLIFTTMFWLRKDILKRLFLLEQAAVRMAEGNYSSLIDDKGNDELSSLSKSFSSMQSSIRINIENISSEKEKLKIILDSIGDGVIAVNRKEKVILMNPVAEKLTGWTFLEAEEKSFNRVFKIINVSTGEKVKSPVTKALKTGKTEQLANHTMLISRSGKKYHIADSGSPIIDNSGKITGVVVIFRDMTEKIYLEEMMIQSEKMLSVGGLAAGMAHEINNPLAGIMQTANVISKRLTESNDINTKAAEKAGTDFATIQRYMKERRIFTMLEDINESGIRAAKIVENMLGFARKSESMVTSNNIASIIDSTLELARIDYDLKKKYDFRGIKIEREYEKDLPLVPCDSGKIQQVLLNLLRNGAQAMQEAGTENPFFVIRVYRDEKSENLLIEVEDNGPGMDEKIRKRIFEPFFTSKPVGEGTGLGLSVSYFIIRENHGGEMSVVSEPGKGATFIITLPLQNG